MVYFTYLKKYFREMISDDKKYEVAVFNTGLIFKLIGSGSYGAVCCEYPCRYRPMKTEFSSSIL